MNIIELLEKDCVIALARKDFNDVLNCCTEKDKKADGFNTYFLEAIASASGFYVKAVTNRLDSLLIECNVPAKEAEYIGFVFYWDEQKHVGIHENIVANRNVDDIKFDWLGHSGVDWADRLYEKVMVDAKTGDSE